MSPLMKNFLALDTSTNTGLVVLNFADGLVSRVQEEPREHNRFLLNMIEAVLKDAKITLKDLDALVCGHGPGSFVGVRLGVAVMQGLAFAIKKPVYALSSLALQAQAFFRLFPESLEVMICHDARMHAVYLGHYRNVGGIAELLHPEQLVSLDGLAQINLNAELMIAGNGAELSNHKQIMSGTPMVQAIDLDLQVKHCMKTTKALTAEELQPVYFDDLSNWKKHP